MSVAPGRWGIMTLFTACLAIVLGATEVAGQPGKNKPIPKAAQNQPAANFRFVPKAVQPVQQKKMANAGRLNQQKKQLNAVQQNQQKKLPNAMQRNQQNNPQIFVQGNPQNRQNGGQDQQNGQNGQQGEQQNGQSGQQGDQQNGQNGQEDQ